jgi:hypothetical protein
VRAVDSEAGRFIEIDDWDAHAEPQPHAGRWPVQAERLNRYCAGKLGGANDVVKRCRREAFQMSVFDCNAYDAAWGDRIP